MYHESPIAPDIIYQDPWIVAINKPSGQLVHRSALDPKNSVYAVQQVRDATGEYVYPIHRLDRPTSGVLLFAFDPKFVTAMQMIWDSRVTKQYQALTRGWVHGAGYIDYALKYQADKIAEAEKNQDVVQSASSSYSVQCQYQAPFATARYANTRYSLLNLFLHSGRKHQLRRHCAHIRHPIIGDTTHGDGKQNSLARKHLGCEHLLLSCTRISFEHPKTGKTVVITSARSKNFDACLSRLESNHYLYLE